MAVLGRKNLPILPQHRREKEKETTEVSIDLNLIQMQTNPNNYSYQSLIIRPSPSQYIDIHQLMVNIFTNDSK